MAKFNKGSRVRLNARTPQMVELERSHPRTVVAVAYDYAKRCYFYTLGSNGRGETKDGNPQAGFTSYLFRSYQLEQYLPGNVGRPKTKRHYHYHRKHHKTDTHNPS